MKNLNTLHISVLIIAILLTSACGKVGEELNPTYSLILENPSGALVMCSWLVDGKQETVETDQLNPGKRSERANEYIALSCLKKNAGKEKIKAVFYRNDSPVETSECEADHCVVSVAGMTK